MTLPETIAADYTLRPSEGTVPPRFDNRIAVGRDPTYSCFPTFSVPNVFRTSFQKIPFENNNAANPLD